MPRFFPDILLSRRTSRMNATLEESVTSNINSTRMVKDIGEVLGPLPLPPEDLDQTWIQRQSNVSGIYEDIEKYRKEEPRVSAIYEQVQNVEPPNEAKLVPPLPPRARVNTKDFSGLKRSFTNTEADYKSKKKSWTAQIMQGLARRFDSGSPKSGRASRKASIEKIEEEMKEKKINFRNKHLKTALQRNKRNSFSSPDLFNMPDSINFERGGSFEFNFLDTNADGLNLSAGLLNISFKRVSSDSSSSGVVADFESDTHSLNNISERIQPSFLINDTSVINLAGSDHASQEPIYQVSFKSYNSVF